MQPHVEGSYCTVNNSSKCFYCFFFFFFFFSEDATTDADQLQTQLKNILTQVKVGELKSHP